MHDWESLAHVRWECEYHVVIIPKYRRKLFYGQFRAKIGAIVRELCRQRGIELQEGHSLPDHIHMGLSIAEPDAGVPFHPVYYRESQTHFVAGTSRAGDATGPTHCHPARRRSASSEHTGGVTRSIVRTSVDA